MMVTLIVTETDSPVKTPEISLAAKLLANVEECLALSLCLSVCLSLPLSLSLSLSLISHCLVLPTLHLNPWESGSGSFWNLYCLLGPPSALDFFFWYSFWKGFRPLVQRNQYTGLLCWSIKRFLYYDNFGCVVKVTCNFDIEIRTRTTRYERGQTRTNRRKRVWAHDTLQPQVNSSRL